MQALRPILEIHSGRPTSDGAGVRLTRLFGGRALERFDPFLMLDEFGSDNPDEYIAGFPAHPHRGFETITYMLEGRMRHRDQMGNIGLLESGGVQWMTAARGVIHSEMPEQTDGVMRGFQLWLNLPASEKLADPDYRDYTPGQLPRTRTAADVEVVVIAGQFDDGQQQFNGAVQRPHSEPHLFDLRMPAGSHIAPRLPDGHRVLLHVYEGEVLAQGTVQPVTAGQMLRLGDAGAIELQTSRGARVLLMAGKPLNEPIVQYGPFVMNSRREIDQALEDFRNGAFATS